MCPLLLLPCFGFLGSSYHICPHLVSLCAASCAHGASPNPCTSPSAMWCLHSGGAWQLLGQQLAFWDLQLQSEQGWGSGWDSWCVRAGQESSRGNGRACPPLCRPSGVAPGSLHHRFPVAGPGISSYADDPAGAGAGLKPCLDRAMEIVPAEQQRETPTYLGATAGMRLLRYRHGRAGTCCPPRRSCAAPEPGLAPRHTGRATGVLPGQAVGMGRAAPATVPRGAGRAAGRARGTRPALCRASLAAAPEGMSPLCRSGTNFPRAPTEPGAAVLGRVPRPRVRDLGFAGATCGRGGAGEMSRSSSWAGHGSRSVPAPLPELPARPAAPEVSVPLLAGRRTAPRPSRSWPRCPRPLGSTLWISVELGS